MRHILHRILFYIGAAWAAITLDFFIPRLAPGDPVAALIGRMSNKGYVTPAMQQALSAQFGLNTHDTIIIQYFKYLGNLLHGNMGNSIQYFPTPVSQIIGQDIGWSLMLGGSAVIISFLLGCLFGIITAWRRGSLLDTILSPAMNFLSAIPYFWLALLSLFIFAYSLDWFPLTGGAYDSFNVTPGWSLDYIASVIQYAFLPALTLVISSLAGWMLTMRNSMITTLSEDYVLMAQAKGLSNARVMLRYAARNAVLPNITGFAIAIGAIVGGQLLTEMVFSYPGIGYALFQAVGEQDYAMIQGVFLIITLAVLGANFLADMLYTFLDPRVRIERGA
ncbi:MAG: ABC transporter permease [Ktedonobacteraceae bacterium]|nr:ABC transporter permease [Ktedonobacteraceae bacterium]MBV9613828.1 ABC transporter permease [Ktedonobacteraceae bacterium]